jgi:hypothetical protein
MPLSWVMASSLAIMGAPPSTSLLLVAGRFQPPLPGRICKARLRAYSRWDTYVRKIRLERTRPLPATSTSSWRVYLIPPQAHVGTCWMSRSRCRALARIRTACLSLTRGALCRVSYKGMLPRGWLARTWVDKVIRYRAGRSHTQDRRDLPCPGGHLRVGPNLTRRRGCFPRLPDDAWLQELPDA